ncbi:MAG: hypothetical protein PHQ04_11890 [Opitutaceae bacterium]|nr:hypothetical protein [Opitutaceae bacterium]
MEANPPANESNDQGLNKIDLSQLQDFTFGTQWTEIKAAPPGRGDSDRGPMRERREDGPGRAGEPKRDRRSFRRPAPSPAGGPSTEREAGSEPRRREDRPRYSGGRGTQPPGERREGPAFERAPYLSPYFNITCYPEDAGFSALVKAVRASCRTFQLFEIARAILEKNDRFIVVMGRKTPEPVLASPAGRTAPAGPASKERPPEIGDVSATAEEKAEAPQPPPAEKPARTARPDPLYLSLPDGLPFDTEEAAIQHVLKHHLGVFFDAQEVEIDPPKGNFPIINRCTITGELLGPPNYHRYQQIIQKHHDTRLNRMPFDRFRERIESVRDPEVVKQWLDKMKKATRYAWKYGQKSAPVAAAPVEKAEGEPAGSSASAESEAPPATDASAIVAPAEGTTTEAVAPAEASPPAAAPVVTSTPAFDTFEEARAYLLLHAKDKVVRAVETVRFHGRLIEKLPPGEIRNAIEGHVERQRRFPLDTANALRGRLRRESFTIFKKGSRGVSYVCAVKRRFRVPGQVFSDTISALIDFIEAHPLIHRKDLSREHLGIDVAAAVAAAPLPEGTPMSQAPFAALPNDEAERLRRMNNDLRWLVIEGYVTEFSDGTLFAPPPMAPQAQKKANEHIEEHDLEDFPAASPVAPTAPAAAETASETAVAPSAELDPSTKSAPAVELPPAPEDAASLPPADTPPPAPSPDVEPSKPDATG